MQALLSMTDERTPYTIADMAFSTNLRKARKAAGVSQEALAQKFKLNRVAVTNWERGNNFPSPAILADLARELRCSLDFLFDVPPGVAGDHRSGAVLALPPHTIPYPNSAKNADPWKQIASGLTSLLITGTARDEITNLIRKHHEQALAQQKLFREMSSTQEKAER